MLVDFKTQDSRAAMAIAVFFHVAILLLFFLFLNFKIPDPPIGTAEVSLSLADFGMDNTGQGNTETETPSPQVEEVVDNEVNENTQEETTTTEEVVTQETAPVTKPSGAATKPTPPKEDPKPTVSNALSNALGNINSSGGGGGDGADGKPGNVGNPNGHIEGKGVFSGDGINGELVGRGYKGGVDTSKKPNEEGTVVVSIYVDRQGNVTRAVIDKKHPQTNTTSQHLWNLAKEQAMTAKFSKDSKATISQKGYIIFHYKLK